MDEKHNKTANLRHRRLPKKGTRVGVLSADMKEDLGLGTYEGEFKHLILRMKNPRILLDSGKRIWGCECWWVSMEEIRKAIAARPGTTKEVTDG